MADRSISELTKVKVHSLKRKASSGASIKSGKSKKFKSDDSASVLSLKTAYGIGKVTDDFDLDDLSSNGGSSEYERPANCMQLDTSKLNRNNGILFSEDITDDHEIWTLHCPDDIDINSFLKQSISFNTVNTLPFKNAMSTKTDLIPYRNLSDTKITIVTPSEETNSLSLNVVPLAGTLVMSHRVKKEKPANLNPLPVDTIEDANRRRTELMSKITQRLANNHDIDTTKNLSLKKENEIETESPKKIKKRKKTK